MASFHKKTVTPRPGEFANLLLAKPENMLEVMEWPQGESHAEITRAVQHLREGRLVVLPTESVYMAAAGALAPGAWDALARVNNSDAPPTILLSQASHIYDWLPFFRGVGLRMARRFWPGPLTLISGAGAEQGVLAGLPRAVRQRLAPKNQLALRLPSHAVARQIAARLDMPLVAVPTSCITAEDAAQSLANHAALLIQNGRAPFAQADTVVHVHGRSWHLVRAGALSTQEIEEGAQCRIVFVCTGNTCRSPLAEGLCRKLLSDKLGCSPVELSKHGFLVQSAGLAAMMGAAATPEAIEIARELGADLAHHRSQPLSIDILLQADRLFAMTSSHLRMLYGVRGVTPRLLARTGDDVADPIGGSAEVYRSCAAQIGGYLQDLLPELLEC